MKKRERRITSAHQIAELSAVFGWLIFGFVIPIVNLSVIPVRWAISYSILEADLGQLARCEKFSQATTAHEDDQEVQTKLRILGGVTLKESRLFLRIQKPNSEIVEMEAPRSCPPGVLASASQIYLTRDTVICISPLASCNQSGLKIPGLNTPVTLKVSNSKQFENTSMDPVTMEYFANE